ncbi:DUF4806 domain-containing protein [Aphis craccivora]|uniref:DUF4806 domain-containing protein n=1 Tax=Aphis craccivora TaxID=307492 RepID=A0A6G0YR43_APHCR|nr:DUF4806 domain-containing protein [Aphis craccivora]
MVKSNKGISCYVPNKKYLKNKDALYLRVNHGIVLVDAFLINFPMNDPLQFSMIENLIMNHSDFTEKLEYFIKTVGGVDPKDHVKRTLGKLFKDKYSIKCT